jgi:hypothetical protein
LVYNNIDEELFLVVLVLCWHHFLFFLLVG